MIKPLNLELVKLRAAIVYCSDEGLTLKTSAF